MTIAKPSLSMVFSTMMACALPLVASANAVKFTQNQSNWLKKAPVLPKRYIIKYKNDSEFTNNAFQNNAISSLYLNRHFNTYGIQQPITDRNNKSVIATLSSAQRSMLLQHNDIDYVEQDLPRRLMAQYQPYGINMVQADLVDDQLASADLNGKKICIIDSGLQLPHSDMGEKDLSISGAFNSGTGSWDQHGGPHGTHVAGTIAALNNGYGVRGVIGSNPALHIVKVFNQDGWGYSSDLVAAIDECKNVGADVVNMSLGGEHSSTYEKNAMQAAADAGLLLIAAAGNDGLIYTDIDQESFPASYDAVMSVAAINQHKQLADFSQKNAHVEIAAPGVDIYSVFPEGEGFVTELAVLNTAYTANPMQNEGNVTAPLFDFGSGNQINSAVNNHICLIKRADISIYDQVYHCEQSGGVGAIIYNNGPGMFKGTLGAYNNTSIPAVSILKSDGEHLLNHLNHQAHLKIGAGDYKKMSGTSMAAPHVSGVAALIWSQFPDCTAPEIRNALNQSAQDLGVVGRDVKFGHGLVQAKEAMTFLATYGCAADHIDDTFPDTSLLNGQVKSSLKGNKNDELRFTMLVPAGAKNIHFTLEGGTGDADLYVKAGSEPSKQDFDCRPYKIGNNERCKMRSTTTEQTFHVLVKGYKAFSDASLVGHFTQPVSDKPQPILKELNDIHIGLNQWQRFKLDIPHGMKQLRVMLNGGSGDADLYVNYETESLKSQYLCRPYKHGNNEQCEFNTPKAGTWYIDVFGYKAVDGLTLRISTEH